MEVREERKAVIGEDGRHVNRSGAAGRMDAHGTTSKGRMYPQTELETAPHEAHAVDDEARS